MTSETFGPSVNRLAFPRPDLRQGDILFIIAVLAISLIALLAGKSELVISRLEQRLATHSVTAIPAEDGTVYDIELSCLPKKKQDVCVAQIGFDYSVADPRSATMKGVLIDQFNGDVTLRVNGELVKATQNLAQMLRLLPQRPVLVDLPPGLLKRGSNRIDFTLQSRSVLGGYLSRVVIGPQSSVTKGYERGIFWRYSVPTLFGGALVFMSCIIAFLGVRHRDKTFLLCALVCCSFSVSTLYDTLPLATPSTALFAIRLLRMVSGIYLGAFIFSVSQVRYPFSLAILCVFPLAYVAVVMIAGSHFEISIATLVFWLFALLFMFLGIMHLAYLQWSNGNGRVGLMPVLATFGIFGGAANFVQAAGFSIEVSQLTRGYAPMMLVVSMSLYLVKQFSDKTIRIERTNDEMAEEIERVTRTLKENHLAAEENRRSLLIQRERQRLMGDLHDGLAGNLITIQALTSEKAPSSLPQINTLARQALLDLRLVVESLDTFEGDLAAALAAFRERIMPQYSQREPKIHWNLQDAPNLLHLTPETSLAIFRILQEAVNNAVRHGRARNVYVVARTKRGPKKHPLIMVIDDGKPNLPVFEGFGMRNMQRRARSIQADLQFHFGSRGTVVRLQLNVGSQDDFEARNRHHA